jgi:hypothetical protein
MRILWGFGALLFLVVGCSAPAPEPGRGDGVILLADRRPGLAMMAEMYDPPDFILYGNGRAVAREERDSGVLKLVEYRLTPQRIRALFSEAADAELFDDEDYSLDAQVPDAASLVIMLRTAEREHLAKVVLPSPEDHGARGKAAVFAESLRPSRWAAGDFNRPPAPYQAGRVAVNYEIATDTTSGNDVPRAWPLPEAEPIEPRCVVLTGAAAARAQELGETVPRTTLWQHGSATFHAWVRPLLPDEADCRASERRYLE